jgi:hypothetical protein
MQCAYRSGCTLPITKVPEANFYTCKAWQVVRAQQLRNLPFVDQRTVGAAQLVCMQGLRAAKMHCMNGPGHACTGKKGDVQTHLSSLSYMAQTRSRNSTSVSGVPMLISAVVRVDDRFRGAGVGATRVCAAIGSCICHARCCTTARQS